MEVKHMESPCRTWKGPSITTKSWPLIQITKDLSQTYIYIMISPNVVEPKQDRMRVLLSRLRHHSGLSQRNS